MQVKQARKATVLGRMTAVNRMPLKYLNQIITSLMIATRTVFTVFD